jgi:hypothetical protein
MAADHDAAMQFLRKAYRPDDWIAVFLKSYVSGRVGQREVPVSLAMGTRIQKWLDRENESDVNVYVSVNAVRPRQPYRRRTTISAIRHIFLDADHCGADVVATIHARRDLPTPSYVLTSSLGLIFWRVTSFTRGASEALQSALARQLQTDTAATSCAQLTRLPGFLNHKYAGAWPVAIEYLEPSAVYRPSHFPRAAARAHLRRVRSSGEHAHAVERARRYVAALPAAVAGRQGDLLTFRLCCRLVRGFALSDVQAFSILGEWNARCEPPWTYRELRDKLNNARRYGREPIGGCLTRRHSPSA